MLLDCVEAEFECGSNRAIFYFDFPFKNHNHNKMNLGGQSEDNNDELFNYRGHLVKVAAEVNPPWFFGQKRDDVSDVFEPNDGTSYHFLRFLAEKLNFTWQLIDRPGEWSMEANRQNNSGQKCIIESLMTGEIEWAMGSIPIRLREYNQSISFTQVVQVSRITYMTLASEPIEILGTIFMPFDLNLWIVILVFICMIEMIVFIFEKFYNLQMDLKWLMISSIMLRGVAHKPLASSGINSLQYVCWLFGWVLLTAYGSAIISSFTNNREDQNIDTMNQFIRLVLAGQVIPLVSKITTYPMLFHRYRQNDEVYATLNKHLEVAENFDAAVERMIQTRMNRRTAQANHRIYALIGPHNYLDLYASRLGRDHFFYKDALETAILTDFFGLMFRANSSMIPHFDRCIGIARSHGFFHKWYRRTFYERPARMDYLQQMLDELDYDEEIGFAATDQPKALTLENVKDLFFFALVCFSIAITILFGEIILLKYRWSSSSSSST